MIGEGDGLDALRRACDALVDVEFEFGRGWDRQSIGALVVSEPDLVVLDLRDQDRSSSVQIASRVRALTRSAIAFVVRHDESVLIDARAVRPMAFLIEPLTTFQCQLVLETALHWANELSSLRRRVQSQRVDPSIGPSIDPSGLAARVDANTPGPDAAARVGVAQYRHCTRREQEVLQLFFCGQRVSTIADRLDISPGTVRSHLKSIFRKMNVRSQAELMETIRATPPPEPDPAGQ
jgi:DNA-binding NarL/FixJ family response regulator